MKQKTVLMAPLVFAVALAMLVTQAAAVPLHEFKGLGGKGFARVGRSDYVYGDAFFGYCFTWDHAVLLFDEMVCGYTGVWEIVDCTVRRYGCFETFRGKWVPETGDNFDRGLLYYENDLCCGDISVMTFLRDGERSFVIVYGLGIFFMGYTPTIMPMPKPP